MSDTVLNKDLLAYYLMQIIRLFDAESIFSSDDSIVDSYEKFFQTMFEEGYEREEIFKNSDYMDSQISIIYKFIEKFLIEDEKIQSILERLSALEDDEECTNPLSFKSLERRLKMIARSGLDSLSKS